MAALKIILANQADPWSNKDCNYNAMVKDNLMAKLYLTKARQVKIDIFWLSLTLGFSYIFY